MPATNLGTVALREGAAQQATCPQRLPASPVHFGIVLKEALENLSPVAVNPCAN
jgi:hypothetical protein